MLNELYALQRGLETAGIKVAPRHADVSSPGRADALQVRLDAAGAPVEIGVMGRDRVAGLWTLRNGKHNSFPYVQLKQPLLAAPGTDAWRKAHGERWKGLDPAGRRQCLRDLEAGHGLAPGACGALVAKGLHDSLKERRTALDGLAEPHAAVPAVVARALLIRDEPRFAKTLLALLLKELGQADDALLDMAQTLLTGRVVQGKLTGCPLWLDVQGGFQRDVADPRHAAAISRALSGGAASGGLGVGGRGVCVLSGVEAPLHEGNFPQPTVPKLGQLYLYSKNADIPAAHRYGRADVAGLPLDAGLPQTLAGALDAITKPEYENRTWRNVPGEKPGTLDLLIAFADGAPSAPVAALIADDGFDPGEEETVHLSDEERAKAAAGTARGAFLARAKEVVEAVKGKVASDFREVPVSVLVLRKVDTGNAKAILHRAVTVRRLHDQAVAWGAALDNLPPWLMMPVPRKKRVAPRPPPLLAPLQLPQATRALFIRGGSERAGREPVGMAASDALGLFLGEAGAEQTAQAALRTVLDRQGVLLAGVAQALRRDQARDGLKASQAFDRDAALRAASLLGLLLAKAGRNKETYMGNAAFQLGQVLAAADVIHAGYCAAVRGGQVPPTLLGNSMLAIAQDDPARALSLLCKRWPPYLAWVQTRADWGEVKKLTGSDKPGEKTKKAIKSALDHASAVKGVAAALHGNLPNAADTDDRFRAELLLGYVAGLPEAERRAEPEGEGE